MKKIINVLLVFVFCCGVLPASASADVITNNDTSNIKNTITGYFTAYYETLKTNTLVDVSKFLDDTPTAIIPKRILENHLLLYNEFKYHYDYYELDLSYNNIDIKDNQANVSLTLRAKYHYNFAPDDIISSNSDQYVVTLTKEDNRWKISQITSDTDLYYETIQLYCNQNSKIALTKDQINEFYNLQDEHTRSLKTTEKNIQISNESSFSIQPTTTSVSYNPDSGIDYARKYSPDNIDSSQLIFGATSPDCTNFVSQCVWAAYGEWNKNGTIAQNRTNVDNKYRMTSSWYGKSYGSTPYNANFVGVVEFYDYVTSAKTTGPVATGYGEASTASFNQSAVNRGDVLQMYNTSLGRYRHSLYISYAYHSPAETIVMVCAHTQNATDKLLEEYLNQSQYSKIRGIHFSSANF